MLTRKEALYYNEQLHPAFAGYLHDGAITQKDALATIFNLLIRGCIDPIWKNNNMLNGIKSVRLMNRKPKYAFEQLILEKLFETKKEITTKEIGEIIKSDEIQKIIKNNLNAISAFPIINEELKFKLGKRGELFASVNGEPIDTINEAHIYKKLVNRWIIPTYISICVFISMIYFTQQKIHQIISYYSLDNFNKSSMALLPMLFIITCVFLTIYLAFAFSNKVVTYDFKNDIIPITKGKYSELYEFLKKYPLKQHIFTNEFLAFSISFGLDNSWNKDFGLGNEIAIDKNAAV